MKQRYGAVTLIAIIGVTTTARAVDCREDTGPWRTLFTMGDIHMQLPVNLRLEAAPDRISLVGKRIECRHTIDPQTPSARTDYLDTGRDWSWRVGAKFVEQGTGLQINGTLYNTPVPLRIRSNTIPDNASPYLVDITPYILTRNSPETPIDIRIGDILGVLRLLQTNKAGSGTSQLTITYIANNNLSVSPSTCTINNNNPIEIDFGDVHQFSIGTDPLTTSIRSDRRLIYSCPDAGITTPITITYKGIASPFNINLLATTNSDVGTALIRAGTAIQVNGSFLTHITNSFGGDDVTFSLVKRTGSLPTSGPVIGSGVLVMGVP
jgi:minor fimbrial subunit